MKISNIISRLKATPGTNDKKTILVEHADNTTLKLLFEMTYSSKYTYWIRAKEVSKCGEREITEEILRDVLENLHGRIVTGHAARDYLNLILESLQKEEQEVLIRCINRDMDCKVSVGLINKTWSNLIPAFPVMLAHKFDAKNTKAFYAAEADYFAPDKDKKLVVQTKSDGGRAEVIFSTSGVVTGYSRNASVLQLMSVFDSHLKVFSGYVLDGEIVFKDSTGKFCDRKTSNGLFNKLVRNTISAEELTNIHFVVWDMIPEADFWNGKCNTTYRDRLSVLMDKVTDSMHNISVVETEIISTVAQAQVFYEKMLSRGEEGAMIKLLDSPWEADRVKHVLKLKEEKDAALLCVATKPHSKNPEWVGSLECVSSCGKIEVSIGSGLSEDDRKKDPSFYVGKIIDLKYNDLLLAKNSQTYSLFLPIYYGIRYDKTVADTLEHLK